MDFQCVQGLKSNNLNNYSRTGLINGTWDALLSIGAYLIDSENSGVMENAELIGGIILGATIFLGFVYTIVTFIITIKTARKSKRESAKVETKETVETIENISE